MFGKYSRFSECLFLDFTHTILSFHTKQHFYIKYSFLLYCFTLTTLFQSLYYCLLFLLNYHFPALFISFSYFSQVMCWKWLSCPKSNHPKIATKKISENPKENLHYRVHLLITMQPKLSLLKLRSPPTIFC